MEQIRKNVIQIILIRNQFGDLDMIINQSYANHKKHNFCNHDAIYLNKLKNMKLMFFL